MQRAAQKLLKAEGVRLGVEVGNQDGALVPTHLSAELHRVYNVHWCKLHKCKGETVK